MRSFLLAITATLLLTANCNAQTFYELLEKGKTSLKEAHRKHGSSTDFDTSVYYLEQAVKLNPNDPEARYFLGHAYDYAGYPDAGSIPDMDANIIIRASKELEATIKLSPKYTGEIVVLDPYTKISAIWGTLALSYLTRGQHDSARWAFAEGKRRGGFSDLSLAYHRVLLDNCAKDAIAFISGDEPCVTKWYLQEVEQYRTDVCLVNIDMLQLPWYSTYLSNNTPTLFSSQQVATDTTPLHINTTVHALSIPIRNTGKIFKWTPTYQQENYSMRNEELFSDIIVHNGFKRKMYYEKTFLSQLLLGLDGYKHNGLLINEISTQKNDTSTKELITAARTFSFDLVRKVNTNIDYDITDITCLRYGIAYDVSQLETLGHIKEAKELYRKLIKAIPAEKYPYNDEQLEEYMTAHNSWLED